MSFEKTWSGDWRARIQERVRQRGFSNVTQYAAGRIGVSLLDLANELGSEDVAAAQIRRLLIDESMSAKSIAKTARDLLARELLTVLPLGWTNPLDETTRSEVAGATARWHTELEDYLEEDATSTALREFLNAQLPEGWRPTNPDDPTIVALVDRSLRATRSP
ncbi:MAG: NUDIX hydrolase [Kofleriaceae bacterium]